MEATAGFCSNWVSVGNREMDAMASITSDQENIEELKHRLLHITLELESARISAEEDKRRNKENIENLIQHLKEACKERDEVRHMLEQLSNKLLPSTQLDDSTVLPHLKTMVPTEQNLSNIECVSLHEEAYNNQQFYGSSSVESLFDEVPSPDMSSMNMGDSSNMVLHQPLVQEHCELATRTCETAEDLTAIDDLIRGKSLPQKGKLLDAVTDAGPLLQTLLLLGTLPQWRNPPS